jgi:hypothetical protein
VPESPSAARGAAQRRRQSASLKLEGGSVTTLLRTVKKVKKVRQPVPRTFLVRAKRSGTSNGPFLLVFWVRVCGWVEHKTGIGSVEPVPGARCPVPGATGWAVLLVLLVARWNVGCRLQVQAVRACKGSVTSSCGSFCGGVTLDTSRWPAMACLRRVRRSAPGRPS